MPEHLADRIARQDHVAEVAPSALFGRHIDGDAWHGLVAGKEPRNLRELILAAASGKARIWKIVRNLLQAEHIEIGELACFLHDPCRVDLRIDAAAPLNVPCDQLH